jgi:hypothetical protein
MSTEEIKLAKKAARKRIDDAGADGVEITDLDDDILDDYPDAVAEIARQSFTTWLKHDLSSARTDDDTPAYGVTDEGRWKSEAMFSVDESEQAIRRAVKNLERAAGMLHRRAERHRLRFNAPVDVPLLLWPDGQIAGASS